MAPSTTAPLLLLHVALLAVEVCSTSSLSYGAESVINAGDVEYTSTATYDANNAITCYMDKGEGGKGKCVHVGKSGTTLTGGAEVQFSTYVNQISVSVFDATYALVCFNDKSDSNRGKCLIVTRSGASLSVGATDDFSNNDESSPAQIGGIGTVAFDDTTAAVCFSAYAVSKARCHVVSRSGNSVTVPTAYTNIAAGTTIGSDGPTSISYVSMVRFDSTNAAMCYTGPNALKKGRCVHLRKSGLGTTASPYTVTISAEFEFEPDYSAFVSMGLFDSSNAIVCWQADTDGDKGKCALVARSGTTSSPTLTIGSAVTFETAAVKGHTGTLGFSATTGMVCYTLQDSGKCRLLYLSDSSLSYSSASVEFNNDGSWHLSVAAFDASGGMVTYKDDSNSWYAIGREGSNATLPAHCPHRCHCL